ALKLLTQSSPQSLARFAREATLLAELRHPTIVRYLSHGRTDDDVPYLAMEWLEGEDLSQRLAQKGLSLTEILTIIQRTAQALAVGHQRGVIHRDIKNGTLPSLKNT